MVVMFIIIIDILDLKPRVREILLSLLRTVEAVS